MVQDCAEERKLTEGATNIILQDLRIGQCYNRVFNGCYRKNSADAEGNAIFEDKFVLNLQFDDDGCTQQSNQTFQEYPIDGTCVLVNNLWAMKFTSPFEIDEDA